MRKKQIKASIQAIMLSVFWGITFTFDFFKTIFSYLLFFRHLPNAINSLFYWVFLLFFYKFSLRKWYNKCSTNHYTAYPLTGFLSALILQKIFSIPTDTLLILLLNLCKKLKSFCGFSNVPDAPLFTRFKLRFSDHIELMFQQMVDYTEPICRQIVSPQPQVPYHSIIFLRKCLLKHITRIAQIERFALYSTQQSLFLN